MASLTYLDTHVVVWLFLPRRELLSADATDQIEDGEVRISPIVLLELEYLHEIGRLRFGAARIANDLENEIGLRVCDLAFEHVTRAALTQTWTRDPFDRLIVGHASAARASLVSRDETVRANYASAVW